MPNEIEDAYDHEDLDIVYVRENIIFKELENDDTQFMHGCKCQNICTPENVCSCIEKFGKSYQHIPDKVLILNKDRANLPIYECNINCQCNTACTNRLVQYGPRQNLKIVNCGAKGLGLITTEFIQCGMFICEYAGEVIPKNVAKIRFHENQKQQRMNYILEFNEYFGDHGQFSTIIDPSRYGNIGRYLNHSCEPNCILVSVRVNGIIPKVCIFANENIPAFEELTFDYGATSDAQKSSFTTCLCNKIKCRTTLPFLC